MLINNIDIIIFTLLACRASIVRPQVDTAREKNTCLPTRQEKARPTASLVAFLPTDLSAVALAKVEALAKTGAKWEGRHD